MTNYLFNSSSFTVSRNTMYNIDKAFANLKPKIQSQGSKLVIQHRGNKHTIPLTQARTQHGFIR